MTEVGEQEEDYEEDYEGEYEEELCNEEEECKKTNSNTVKKQPYEEEEYEERVHE